MDRPEHEENIEGWIQELDEPRAYAERPAQ